MITGAPWTKGVKRGEVGGSVIIGCHKKKAQKALLKDQAEIENLSRLNALRKYLRTPERDPHISLEEIFRQREKRKLGTLFSPVIHYFKNRKSKLLTDEIET